MFGIIRNPPISSKTIFLRKRLATQLPWIETDMRFWLLCPSCSFYKKSSSSSSFESYFVGESTNSMPNSGYSAEKSDPISLSPGTKTLFSTDWFLSMLPWWPNSIVDLFICSTLLMLPKINLFCEISKVGTLLRLDIFFFNVGSS